MNQVYTIREDSKINLILNETYDDLLAAAQHRNPEATELTEDRELFKLHSILALLRTGNLNISWAEDRKGQFMVLEVVVKPSKN